MVIWAKLQGQSRKGLTIGYAQFEIKIIKLNGSSSRN